MIAIYISFCLLVILILVLTYFIVMKDSFQNYLIRINEAEANIETTLNKRFDLLNKSNEVIKEEFDRDDDVLTSVAKIRSQKLDNFTLDEKLYDCIQEFHEYSEIDFSLKENDNYTKIEIDLLESESEIVALKKYYNDMVKDYNALLQKFPYTFYSNIKHYEEKELFEIKDNSKLIKSLKEQI